MPIKKSLANEIYKKHLAKTGGSDVATTFETSKPSKYGNVRTEVDGVVFDSAKESRRYLELKTAEKAGLIQELTLQPRYPLVIGGSVVATYIADFRYMQEGRVVIEDVKGMKTQTYRLKKKMFEALYAGLKIVEI